MLSLSQAEAGGGGPDQQKEQCAMTFNSLYINRPVGQ
jgi:hypothetical protein